MSGTTTRAQEAPQGVKRWRRMPAEPDIQAVQLLDSDDLDWYAIAAWCGGEVGVRAVGDSGEFDSYIEIPGQQRCAFEGAWIVRRASGFGVIEDFVFHETYELADITPPPSHRCEFPVQPPHGSLACPGPCDCGETYLASIAEQRATEAGLVAVDPADLRAAVERLPVDGEYMRGVRDRLAAAAGAKS